MNIEGDEARLHRARVQREFARSRVRLATIALVAVAAVAASAFGYRAFQPVVVPKTPSVLINVRAPGVGMIDAVLVKPGEFVRKGELIATFDTSHLRAQLDAAKAELVAATAASEAPTVATVQPTAGPTPFKGGFEKTPVALPPVPYMNAPQAKLPAVNSKLGLPAAQAVTAGSGKSVADAEAKIKDLESKRDLAKANLSTLKSEMEDAKSAMSSAQSLVTSAQVVADRTRAERDKDATLLAEGVVSASEASKSDAFASQAQGQLQAAKIRAATAVAQVGEKQRALDSAEADIAKAQTELPKDQAALEAAKKAVVAAPVRQIGAMPPTVQEPRYKLVKLKGPIANTPPPQPVHVDFTPPAQANLRLVKAQAAYDAALAAFTKVCVYAPQAGRVQGIFVRIGQTVQPGAAVVVLER